MAVLLVGTVTLSRKDASLWKAVIRRSICYLWQLAVMFLIPIIVTLLLEWLQVLGLVRIIELTSTFSAIFAFFSLFAGVALSVLDYWFHLPRVIKVADGTLTIEGSHREAVQVPLNACQVAAGKMLNDDYFGEFLTNEQAIVLSYADESGYEFSIAIATSDPSAKEIAEELRSARVPIGTVDLEGLQIRRPSWYAKLMGAGLSAGMSLGSAVNFAIHSAFGANKFAKGTFLVATAFCVIVSFHYWAHYPSPEARRVHHQMLPRKLSVACGFFSIVGCGASNLSIAESIIVVLSLTLFGAVAGILISALPHAITRLSQGKLD